MHGMSRLAEKLNIPYCIYSMGNCVHYICTKCLDLQKIWICRTTKIQREIVYTIYVWNVWFYRKIEYPELKKFNEKLFSLYMYGMSGFAKNWISRTAKIQREIVYIIYVREVLFWRKIEYPELRKFVGKLCTLYIYGTSWFQKIWLPGTVKIQLEIVYTIYVRNVKICREIEFPEPSNLNGKLYT